MPAWLSSNGDAMTMSEGELAIGTLRFVRGEQLPPKPPPHRVTGPLAWLRDNLFSSNLNIALSIVVVLLIAWAATELFRFLILDAAWTGADRGECLESVQHRPIGACWPFVWERLPYFTYGSYPIPQRWRVDLFFLLLAIGIAWLMWLKAPRRDIGALYFFIILPVASFILLHGWDAIGLPVVDTVLWGGILVTIVVATVGIVISLPLGILLALGRRSHMPTVKIYSIVFIEFVRGVPLITVLFMASVMLPLFLPPDFSPDKLIRALVGVSLFSSAYMAEVVRAGLQAIPKGQWEASGALGLGYWQTLRFVVLPQALRVTIPNIVNSYVALFKDTTLVFFVGIFDFLKTIETARAKPGWATPVTSASGYAFAALVYFVFCYSMSRYATGIERRLAVGDRR